MSINNVNVEDKKMEDYNVGRKQIINIIGLVILSELATIISTNVITGTVNLGVQAIRFVLTLAFCYFLYTGKKWANTVMSVLFVLGIFMSIITALTLGSIPLLRVISLIFTVIYGYCYVTLASSKHVKEFMSQKNL